MKEKLELNSVSIKSVRQETEQVSRTGSDSYWKTHLLRYKIRRMEAEANGGGLTQNRWGERVIPHAYLGGHI